MDIQYLTLLERILFLLVEFCRNAPGSYCRGCVDAGCRLECCFYRVELLEACLCCREPGALFCRVEFCRNAPGSYCRGCVDTGCRLECCFYRVELLEACLCCREPGALFCHVECLETREQSLEDALY